MTKAHQRRIYQTENLPTQQHLSDREGALELLVDEVLLGSALAALEEAPHQLRPHLCPHGGVKGTRSIGGRRCG
jgi:hypothetical protein